MISFTNSSSNKWFHIQLTFVDFRSKRSETKILFESPLSSVTWTEQRSAVVSVDPTATWHHNGTSWLADDDDATAWPVTVARSDWSLSTRPTNWNSQSSCLHLTSQGTDATVASSVAENVITIGITFQNEDRVESVAAPEGDLLCGVTGSLTELCGRFSQRFHLVQRVCNASWTE